jgi:NADH-quinone oxidoreductase subunit G
MPKITVNGQPIDFNPGEVILKAANRAGVTVPQYCYHDGLSIVASCRICLAEVWQPDPKTGKLAPVMGGKLMPTCQTAAADGMVVYTDSPKAVANQKAVMEYLLINHPLDCPVCDQAGECYLQDYSYEYGRGQSRFEENKVKQPKKDLGPHVYLYSDRCIMCTRCVRFTREVSGTAELLVTGRGNREEIDVFPGKPIDNELSGNVVDLCPVGALLDKDFLFAQRVWFLKETPSIDGITASGDNISVHHNDGTVYRVKPRTNLSVNKWWITDEVRHGWKFVHREDRLNTPKRRQFGLQVDTDFDRALRETADGLKKLVAAGKRVALVVSPMLACEEAFTLAKAIRAIDDRAFLAVGPVPVHGQDKIFPIGAQESDPRAFKLYAEKAPNARGVRRVLEALSRQSPHNGYVASYEQLLTQLKSGEIAGVLLTGNYPSDWATPELIEALRGKFVALIDTLPSALAAQADILLPGATWLEKAGTFENARHMIQAFEQAIPVRDGARTEGQLGLDLLQAVSAVRAGSDSASRGTLFNAGDLRAAMAAASGDLAIFTTGVAMPAAAVEQEPDMVAVEV